MDKSSIPVTKSTFNIPKKTTIKETYLPHKLPTKKEMKEYVRDQ